MRKLRLGIHTVILLAGGIAFNLGTPPDARGQDASNANRTAEALVVRCTRGDAIDAECIRSSNRTLMTEAGEALRTGLQNFGPEFRDAVESIARQRGLAGGMAGNANRTVLLGMARSTASAIRDTSGTWGESDRAAVEQVRTWQGMTCNPSASGSSVAAGCAAVALAATLTDLCADDGLNGACIRAALPMLRDQMNVSAAAFARVNLRVETVSALGRSCGASAARHDSGVCTVENSLTLEGDVAYNRLPGGRLRTARRSGGRSGSRDGDRTGTATSESEGTTAPRVAGGSGGTGPGRGATGTGSGGGGEASSTESGDGRAVAVGGNRVAGEVGGRGEVSREGVSGTEGGREGGRSGRPTVGTVAGATAAGDAATGTTTPDALSAGAVLGGTETGTRISASMIPEFLTGAFDTEERTADRCGAIPINSCSGGRFDRYSASDRGAGIEASRSTLGTLASDVSLALQDNSYNIEVGNFALEVIAERFLTQYIQTHGYSSSSISSARALFSSTFGSAGCPSRGLRDPSAAMLDDLRRFADRVPSSTARAPHIAATAACAAGISNRLSQLHRDILGVGIASVVNGIPQELLSSMSPAARGVYEISKVIPGWGWTLSMLENTPFLHDYDEQESRPCSFTNVRLAMQGIDVGASTSFGSGMDRVRFCADRYAEAQSLALQLSEYTREYSFLFRNGSSGRANFEEVASRMTRVRYPNPTDARAAPTAYDMNELGTPCMARFRRSGARSGGGSAEEALLLSDFVLPSSEAGGLSEAIRVAETAGNAELGVTARLATATEADNTTVLSQLRSLCANPGSEIDGYMERPEFSNAFFSCTRPSFSLLRSGLDLPEETDNYFTGRARVGRQACLDRNSAAWLACNRHINMNASARRVAAGGNAMRMAGMVMDMYQGVNGASLLVEGARSGVLVGTAAGRAELLAASSGSWARFGSNIARSAGGSTLGSTIMGGTIGAGLAYATDPSGSLDRDVAHGSLGLLSAEEMRSAVNARDALLREGGFNRTLRDSVMWGAMDGLITGLLLGPDGAVRDATERATMAINNASNRATLVRDLQALSSANRARLEATGSARLTPTARRTAEALDVRLRGLLASVNDIEPGTGRPRTRVASDGPSGTGGRARSAASPEGIDGAAARSAGSAPTTAAASDIPVLAIDGATRGRAGRLVDRLNTFFGSGPMRRAREELGLGEAPPSRRGLTREQELLEKMRNLVNQAETANRLLNEAGSLGALADRVAGGLSESQLGAIFRDIESMEAEFVPILADTLRNRFQFEDADIRAVLARGRAARRAGAGAGGAGSADDPFRVLVRSLSETDDNGHPVICRAMRSAGCGVGTCQCPAICN